MLQLLDIVLNFRISYIASSGGLLGLCMGFSFVSLAEIAYHLFLCISLIFKKRKSWMCWQAETHPRDEESKAVRWEDVFMHLVSTDNLTMEMHFLANEIFHNFQRKNVISTKNNFNFIWRLTFSFKNLLFSRKKTMQIIVH